ncbi:DUF4283 domain-containing protein [Abeliophyllum distichum]|uniref:DUF4283 domain-containing protein n=1 Tax=Abeliophyllum distichum TaxID=126358 RepID=A0ABD1UNJ8_9LAMI
MARSNSNNKVDSDIHEIIEVKTKLVNRDKSGFIVPKRSPPSRIQILEHITGFKRQQQPFTYLGIPLFKGARKTFLYDDLLPKVKSKISRWAFRLLSSGGRITLLRSVLSSLSLYLFQIMQPPKTVLKKLESTFARFLWDSKDQAHRMHSRRWKDICLPADKAVVLGSVFIGQVLQEYPSHSGPHTTFCFCSLERLKGVGLIAEPHIAWQLGQGRIFFWHDCWMGDMTLAQMFPHREHTSVQGLVPVDVIIQKRIRAHMASRCQFCSEIETIQHFFIDSLVAHQVYWCAPSAGSTKINTDGCIRDGFASGGAIIRDHTGHCIRAFSASYRDIFILEAELRAILQGIELARRMGLVDL